jgi:hypothetical protein
MPGRKADHSPPSSAEVKNAWSYTSTLPIRLSWRGASLSTGTTLPLPLAYPNIVFNIVCSDLHATVG